ncbi:MAG: hypothetical protein ACFUZC_02735 [Chthoniobacteraceae bacterium]
MKLNAATIRKKFHLLCCLGGLLWLILSASSLADVGKLLGEVDSEWPGVKFQVTQIQWIDSEHLLVTVRLVVGPGAANPTLIGIESSTGAIPKSAPSQEVASGKYDSTPFSLKTAILYDEGTHQNYPALPGLPAKPFLGPNALLTTLRPGNWIQLAVQFPAPPPPPDDQKTISEQKVTLVFPKAKGPIRHLILPLNRATP